MAGWNIAGTLPSKYGHCERTVDGLVGGIALARIPDGADYRTLLVLTEHGSNVLAQWTSQHGEPT